MQGIIVLRIRYAKLHKLKPRVFLPTYELTLKPFEANSNSVFGERSNQQGFFFTCKKGTLWKRA